ncbi:MAG: HAD-IB family hydrolase, partial [Burkholderiaceae bacterium]|nr:HAD-IB family hydrolase [Burkholderiaceae bacterium]
MQRVIEPALRDSARELVRRHKAQGDQVALVTATNEFVTAPIAAAFGISTLIAVQLERDARGSITGRIRGTPSYREGKVRRVEEWLGEQGASWSDCARISVYSDSLNDLPLLEMATDPVATNPSPALLAVAHQRGWPTLNLFT